MYRLWRSDVSALWMRRPQGRPRHSVTGIQFLPAAGLQRWRDRSSNPLHFIIYSMSYDCLQQSFEILVSMKQPLISYWKSNCRIRLLNWRGRRLWHGRWTTRAWPFAFNITDPIKALVGCASTRPTTSSCATVSTASRKNENGLINPHPPCNASNCYQSTEITISEEQFFFQFFCLNSCCIISFQFSRRPPLSFCCYDYYCFFSFLKKLLIQVLVTVRRYLI